MRSESILARDRTRVEPGRAPKERIFGLAPTYASAPAEDGGGAAAIAASRPALLEARRLRRPPAGRGLWRKWRWPGRYDSASLPVDERFRASERSGKALVMGQGVGDGQDGVSAL